MKKTLLGVCLLFLLASIDTFAQTRTVTGVVISGEDNLPLPGVNVSISGTTRGTITSLDGDYSIEVSSQDTLQFSFIGFSTAKRAVGNQNSIDVILEVDTKTLGEVVVVGYGSQEKKELTGAVAQLDSRSFENTPIASLDQAMQGRIAGVQISQNSGTPGGGISVRVRGSSSISASNQPLYVVDGIPVNSGDPSHPESDFGGQSASAINDINPSDIASIEVLKDAAAAAIYGSRAANGVVLITTKRGSANQTRINFNAYAGVQDFWKQPKMLNSQQYLELAGEAFADWGWTGEDFVEGYYGGFPFSKDTDTDWVDEVSRSASIQNYDLSIAGGNDKTQFFLSGSYFDQEGIIIGSRFQRFTTRINLDHQFSDRLSVGTSTQLSRSVNTRIVSDNTLNGPFANSLAASPLWEVKNEDGTYSHPQFYYPNPVAVGLENDNQGISLRAITSGFATYEIAEGLKLTGRVAADVLNYQERNYIPSTYPGSFAGATNGFGMNASNTRLKYVTEAFLEYEKDFGEDHSLQAVAGTNRENNDWNETFVEGEQFPGDVFRYLGAAAVINGGGNNIEGYGIVSYFGRANYSYKDRYLLSASFRADASSRFGQNNRWGYFPAVSLGWRIVDEPFMEDQTVFTDLKVRGSYGLTGNQEFENFNYMSLYGPVNYMNNPALAPVRLGNPDLKWEATSQTNIGVDFSVLNGRVSLSADYYIKNTDDLIFNRPIPTQNGFASYTSNIGSIENKGFEFGLTTINVDSPSGFTWRSELNISLNKNKVTELYNGEDVFYGFGGNSLVLREGQPIGTFYGLLADGVYATTADVPEARREQGIQAGDMNYRDINNDGVITDDDFTIIGNAQPDFIGGFTNTVRYRNFDLNLFMQFSVGNEIWNAAGTYQQGMFANEFDDNNSAKVLDRWRKEGDITNVPRATTEVSVNRNNLSNTSRFVEDGSYLRVKNLTLGYTLPKSVTERISVQSLRIYAQAQNLFTWTGYSGFDPEVNFAGTDNRTLGVDFYTIPQTRTITLGLNLGF
jgi:TonB-linked SusC/RagA family outer membrane protein